MENLGKPRSNVSCHFTKYKPRCKSCWYNIKVFSENMGHPEPIQMVIIKKCPKLLRIYGNYLLKALGSITTGFQDGERVEWNVYDKKWKSQ